MSRWRQVPAVLASLLLVGLALWAGFSTLPTTEAARPAFSIQLESDRPLDVWLGRTSPLFVFEDELFPRQCGNAWIDSSRTVRLAPYASAKCRAALDAAANVSLHPAGLRLLWSTLAAPDRDTIAREAWELLRGMLQPLSEILNSPYFNERYREELARIPREALRQAWAAPRVQLALAETLSNLDASHTEQLVNHLWPLMLEKAEAGLWDSVASLGDILLGRRGESDRRSLTGRVLRDMLADPRTQARLFEALIGAMSDPLTIDLANLFATEFLVATMADPHLPELVDRIATDPLILSQRQAGPVNFDFVTKELPRRLLRYRHPRDHNPLAAYLVRGILRGSDAFAVFMMTDDQFAQAQAQGQGAGISLRLAQP